MSTRTLTIWSNVDLPPGPAERLTERLGPHQLVKPQTATRNNLHGAPADPQLAHADVAFGQPDPNQVMQLAQLRWVQLTTAGYTRYDTPAFRDAAKRNGTVVCNASSVYAEPCAQHVLAMMLAHNRRLVDAFDNQRGEHDWPYLPLRAESKLLNGQTVLLVGYGAIARHLARMLAAFSMNLVGFRRHPDPRDAAARVLPIDQLDEWLPRADHVVNVLPSSPQTQGFFDAARFARFRRGAAYYNIGRGNTNDEAALRDWLAADPHAEAYVDAFAKEPLPPGHFLWTTPRCVITPHTAGGHATEYERHVDLFLENLRRFQAGEALMDRIM
jgi:phosphoglycerate dehydrogenase-like enzyme